MNTERLIKIVLMDLTTDGLKLEEQLENTMNNKELNVDIKISTIKHLLCEIVKTETSINKITNMLQNKDNEKTKEN
jgi:hypothetical protein